jgi:predicted CoA-binding protein
LDKLLARSQAGYADTGIMSPQLSEALKRQIETQGNLEQLYRTGGVNLELGKKKLEAIQPILSDLHDHPENMMQDLMSIETLTGGGGGAAMALGPLLSAMTPQSEPGMTTAGSLEATHPGFLASQGLTGLHPNTPVRVQVNKFTRQPVSAQVSSVAEQLKPFGEGVYAYNPREGTLTPQQGVTPISMLPSTQTSPGSAPVTTQKGKPATTGAGGGVPPVGGAGGGASAKPAAGQFNSTLDQTARDVVQGVQSMPSDSRTANAVRDSARRQGLTIPPVYPAPVQDALAKNATSLDQINQVLSLLEPYKNSKDILISAPERLEYKLGYTNPDNPWGQAIGKISVTDILAAGRVLGSAGIRSNRFNYNDALTHTPDPWKDSGTTMYNKLVWMKQLIEDQNKNSLKYQRKSGVIPTGGGSAPASGKPPATAQEYLDSIGH